MLHPTVFNTSQICHQLGVRYAVLSPGSRNAPLLISFSRHQEIEKVIVPDERVAGFIALGIAQQTHSPVVLACTSGTALLNYAPAIAEAYYRELPLLVLSADRPPELIDQRDGQTIRQFEVLKNHVKRSYQLPVVECESNVSQYQSELISAIQHSKELPKGPVHLNIPFKEPFYPGQRQDELSFEAIALPQESGKKLSYPALDVAIPENKNILLLIGQNKKDEELGRTLEALSGQIPILRSPLNNLQIGVQYVDAFIKDQRHLKPDVLITSGLSVLSKNLKLFLRNYSPELHYHFDPSGIEVDTFSSSPRLVRHPLVDFLSSLKDRQFNNQYLARWKSLESIASEAIQSYLNTATFSEALASNLVFKSIPADSILHLSNSMPVRYADLFGVPDDIEVYCNRGTSGIDGCTSTALGTALVTDKLNVLVTGDLAFLYDRNAFFHNHPQSNLRVIVMNNQGGGIFRLIPGPSAQPELEDYFETRHNRTAEYICAENKLDYLVASSESELKVQLKLFLEPSNTGKVLEVFTDPTVNQAEYRKLRNHINEQL